MRRRGFVRIPVGFSAIPCNLERIVRLDVKGFNSVALASCVAALVVLSSCASSNSSSSSSSRKVLAVNATNGSLQSVLIGTTFPTPLSAVVTQNGNPMSGVTVIFTAPSTGASGTFSNGTVTENDPTDSNGIATSSTFTGNPSAGAYAVSAAVSGASASATFNLTNLSTSMLTIVSVNGSQQRAKVGTPFSMQLEAGVFNAGVPVSGVTVTFIAPSSPASGTFANGITTESDITDSNGHAMSSTFTANATPGSYSVNATLSGNSMQAGQGSVTGGTMNLTGLVSDPFEVLTSSTTTSGDSFVGTPLPDINHPGRSTMSSTNLTPNPLMATIGSKAFDYNVVVYQASGQQLFWLDVDTTDVFLGPIEQQGSLNGIPAVRKKPVK